MENKSYKKRAKGFWATFKTPILLLAPMADVTDPAFRKLIAKYGKPDVMFTEFVSCDGLMSAGKEKLMENLRFSEEERPILVQFFGAKPENFAKCAELAAILGFDGIDINMGCPDKNINKQRAGADLIRDPKLAQKIISETKRGAGGLPVSVKTRTGLQKENIDEWIKYLLESEPAAITIHGRTKKEMSKVPANWQDIARAAELAKDTDTLIIGNGDVLTIKDAMEKAEAHKVDGVMIGRGIFGNPWLFSKENRENPNINKKDAMGVKEKISVLIEHIELFKNLMKNKSFSIMKKHFKAYINEFDGAKELRNKLMEINDPILIKNILKEFLAKTKD